VNVKMEPSLIAVGAKHLAVACNNIVWLYDIKRTGNYTYKEVPTKREFLRCDTASGKRLYDNSGEAKAQFRLHSC